MLFTLYNLHNRLKPILYIRCIRCISDKSKTCSHCGHINKELNLKDRVWDCKNCAAKSIQRDFNAAVNLQRLGASSLGLDDVRQLKTAIVV